MAVALADFGCLITLPAEKLAEWLKNHPEDRAALRAELDKEFWWLRLLRHNQDEPKIGLAAGGFKDSE